MARADTSTVCFGSSLAFFLLEAGYFFFAMHAALFQSNIVAVNNIVFSFYFFFFFWFKLLLMARCTPRYPWLLFFLYFFLYEIETQIIHLNIFLFKQKLVYDDYSFKFNFLLRDKSESTVFEFSV